MICARPCSDLSPGAACPDCGHWSGVHPGVHNPALLQCVICEVQAVIVPAVLSSGGVIRREECVLLLGMVRAEMGRAMPEGPYTDGYLDALRTVEDHLEARRGYLAESLQKIAHMD